MDDPRLIVAIGRIERGLARIERAAAAEAERFAAVDQRHRVLRGATEAILAEIDEMLAEPN